MITSWFQSAEMFKPQKNLQVSNTWWWWGSQEGWKFYSKAEIEMWKSCGNVAKCQLGKIKTDWWSLFAFIVPMLLIYPDLLYLQIMKVKETRSHQTLWDNLCRNWNMKCCGNIQTSNNNNTMSTKIEQSMVLVNTPSSWELNYIQR